MRIVSSITSFNCGQDCVISQTAELFLWGKQTITAKYSLHLIIGTFMHRLVLMCIIRGSSQQNQRKVISVGYRLIPLTPFHWHAFSFFALTKMLQCCDPGESSLPAMHDLMARVWACAFKHARTGMLRRVRRLSGSNVFFWVSLTHACEPLGLGGSLFFCEAADCDSHRERDTCAVQLVTCCHSDTPGLRKRNAASDVPSPKSLLPVIAWGQRKSRLAWQHFFFLFRSV